jgi:hypothetical protein
MAAGLLVSQFAGAVYIIMQQAGNHCVSSCACSGALHGDGLDLDWTGDAFGITKRADVCESFAGRLMPFISFDLMVACRWLVR